MRSSILIFVILTVVSHMTAFGQIPEEFNYQGYLTDNSGNPISGNRVLTFKLYNADVGGDKLLTVQDTVNVDAGFFNATINVKSRPTEMDFSDQYWLTIQIDSGEESSPRTRLTSTPYSLNAANAEDISDDIVTELKIRNGAVKASKIDISAGGDLIGDLPDPTIAKLQGTALSIGGTPSSGQVLKWSGTAWSPGQDNTGSTGTTVNVTPRLDGDGSAGNPLDIHQQEATQGQVLKWNGTAWAPDNDGTSGSAGGDLTGNYPNPTIANNAVTSDKIQDGTIQGSDIAQNAITSDMIFGGPKVALSYGPSFFSLENNPSINQIVDSLTIYLQTDGVVIAEASGYINIDHTTGVPDNIVINIHTDPNADLFTFGACSFTIPFELASSADYRYSFTCRSVFEITAVQSLSLYLLIRHLNGSKISSTRVAYPVLTATFYGSAAASKKSIPVYSSDGFDPSRRK